MKAGGPGDPAAGKGAQEEGEGGCAREERAGEGGERVEKEVVDDAEEDEEGGELGVGVRWDDGGGG